MIDLFLYEKNDPDFVEDLMRSDKHVDKVIKWLESRGHEVIKNEIKIRPKIEQMSEYSDNGDIWVKFKNSPSVKRKMEVKQRFINFTSIQDFPYKTVIVDVSHCWDKADPKPVAYILTNKEVTACMLINTDTSSKWIKKTKWDSKKKRERVFYECPIELAKFYKM